MWQKTHLINDTKEFWVQEGEARHPPIVVPSKDGTPPSGHWKESNLTHLGTTVIFDKERLVLLDEWQEAPLLQELAEVFVE